jgi:predicted RNA-binding protein
VFNHLIFVVKDHKSKDGKITRAEEVLRHRAKYGFWYLNSKAPNFKRVNKGDKVLFYVAGKKGGKFCGGCILASNPYKVSKLERRPSLGKPSEEFDYVVDLSAVDLWKHAVTVEEIKDKVSFLRHKKMPKLYFRGSIRIIPEEDFLAIKLARDLKEKVIQK